MHSLSLRAAAGFDDGAKGRITDHSILMTTIGEGKAYGCNQGASGDGFHLYQPDDR